MNVITLKSVILFRKAASSSGEQQVGVAVLNSQECSRKNEKKKNRLVCVIFTETLKST